MLLLLLVVLASAPLERLSEPPAALQGLVFLLRSPTSPAKSGHFPDLRSALLVADDGDTLILEPGLFTGLGNKDLVVTKDVTIRGRFGPLGSVIDCEGAGRAFDFQGAQAIVEGLAICGGLADAGGGARVSGGTVLFQNVTFAGNSARDGGGVHSDYSSILLLFHCRFLQNSAVLNGGAISVGGVGTFTECLLERNEAAQLGGGLSVLSEIPPRPVHASLCSFRGNSAGLSGGGASVFLIGNMSLDRCTLVGNQAGTFGGGVGILSPFAIAFVTNSLVAGNTSRTGAGGIHGGPAGITNCTVIENMSLSMSAGGVQTGSAFAPSAVLNCIVRDNRSSATTLLGQQIQEQGPPPDLTLLYSNVAGLSGSRTNIDLDPRFVDPASGDYHILPSSPCVDAGLAFSLTNLQRDIDNEARFQGLSVDIGCDEVPVPAGP